MAKKKKLTQGRGWSLEREGVSPVPQPVSLPPAEQRIKVTLDRRRKGKVVTLAAGFTLTRADLAALAKELRQVCGCGGTAKEGAIELQGEHLEKVREALGERGYRV